MTLTCWEILALKDLTALLTDSLNMISLAWGCDPPTGVIAYTNCQISDFQRHAAGAETAQIPGSGAKATPCPHSKNEPMSLF
jgi:hypothetical protein